MNLAFGEASNHAGGIDGVFWYITWISTALLVGITIVMIYFVIKYHKSRHPKAEHVHDSMALELTWTILPTILVMTMFWYGWVVFRDMRKIPDGAFEVQVNAKQWNWEYEYKESKIRRTGKQGLVIALNRPVVLRFKSTDVLHAFYVPAFRLKEDIVPGRDYKTYLSFTPTKLGTFDVFCAEYCGGTGSQPEIGEDGHWSMLSKVHVVTEEEFDRGLKNGGDWSLDGTKPPAAGAGKAEAGAGEHPGLKLLRTRGCFSCHSDAKYGPPFDGLFGKRQTVLIGDQERSVEADEEYLRRAIVDPDAEIVAEYYRHPRMAPTKDLSDREMRDVLDYLKQLK